MSDRRKASGDVAAVEASVGAGPRLGGVPGTRERIVVAASEAFAANGYHGVNLNDVVVRLGLTKGALYYFFPTKERLVQEITDRHLESFDSLGKAVLPRDQNRLDEVVDLSYRMAELFRSDPITRAGVRLTVERNTVKFDLPRPYAYWIGRFTKLLRQARSRGELKDGVNPKDLAELIVAYLYGAYSISSEFDGQRDLRVRLDRFWAMASPAYRPGG